MLRAEGKELCTPPDGDVAGEVSALPPDLVEFAGDTLCKFSRQPKGSLRGGVFELPPERGVLPGVPPGVPDGVAPGVAAGVPPGW